LRVTTGVAQSPETHIGTAGFSFPHWQGSFYPRRIGASQWLRYYAQHFQSVEINTTFYAEPRAGLLGNWRMQVGSDFRFSLKASRVITHEKTFRGARTDLARMAEQFAELGGQLSTVLFQLPPFLEEDIPLLSHALEETQTALGKHFAVLPRIAFEFRHRSWSSDRTLELLRRSGASMVIHDVPRSGGWKFLPPSDGELMLGSHLLRYTTSEWKELLRESFLYIRFHGTVDGYERREYGREELAPWALFIRELREADIPFFGYFKNDPGAAAVRDALLLQEMLGVENLPEQAVQTSLFELAEEEAEMLDTQSRHLQ